MRAINSAGVALIKFYEGCELKAYKDQSGFWTIGYGHRTGALKEITQEVAERLLSMDLQIAAASVDSLTHDLRITDNQFAALGSFVFNLGHKALRDSFLLRCLREGDNKGAALEFMRWVFADGKPSDGLRKRRRAERALFEKCIKPA